MALWPVTSLSRSNSHALPWPGSYVRAPVALLRPHQLMTPAQERSLSPDSEAFQSALLGHIDSLSQAQRDVFASGTVNQALVFAQRLDAEQEQRSQSRSLAIYASDVIDSLGDFFKVISTAVSAHPEIAAFVWGGIRFVMEVSLVQGMRVCLLTVLTGCVALCSIVQQDFRCSQERVRRPHILSRL